MVLELNVVFFVIYHDQPGTDIANLNLVAGHDFPITVVYHFEFLLPLCASEYNCTYVTMI